MSTRIGLVSDPHAAPEPLAEALSIFRDQGVERIICAGDIAGYNTELEATIDLLIEHRCQAILGNHDVAWLAEHQDLQHSRDYRFLQGLPQTLCDTIEGKSLYVVHAQPPDELHGGIKLLDVDGEVIPERRQTWSQQLSNFDHNVLIVGHTHQVFTEQLGPALVINPGSSVFNHSCALLSLPEMTVEVFGLSGREPLKLWNWGMYIRSLQQQDGR